MKRIVLVLGILTSPGLFGNAHAAISEALATGDAAWARRADGADRGRADPDPIEAARSAYESALALRPDSLEASWKLLRALHFAGDFAVETPEARAPIFERAREVSARALDALARRLEGDAPPQEQEVDVLVRRIEAAGLARGDVARVYFWSAIAWAAWSRDAGLLDAVRQGVATRLYDYTRLAIALDPDVEQGGAYRLLGRLHAELPRVPFLTSWVDRERALPLIERAYAIAPEHPGNRLLLALTILGFAPERREEAQSLLREVDRTAPRAESRVEDEALREAARDKLATL